MSNCYPVNKSYGDKKDCHHHGGGHHDHHPHVDCKPNKTIFRCKETPGNNSIIATIVTANTPVTVGPITLGNITIRDLCCFKDPCVRIDTTGLVTASATAAGTIRVRYILSKRCEGDNHFNVIKEVELPPVNVYVNQTLVSSQLPSFCDCEELCGRDCCCQYKLEATFQYSAAAAGNTATINISQGIISAIAGDNC